MRWTGWNWIGISRIGECGYHDIYFLTSNMFGNLELLSMSGWGQLDRLRELLRVFRNDGVMVL